MTIDYRINVPSYERSQTLASATLALLDRYSVDRDRVTVWVADDQQREIYDADVGDSWRVRVSAPGLLRSRCVYHESYPAGTRLLNLDDDLSDLVISTGRRLVPFPGRLDDLVTEAFGLAERNDLRLWGVNAAANPGWLKPQISIGLRYVVGALFGSYAGDSIWSTKSRTGVSSGEDFESTLLAYCRDGAVMRYDGLSIKTAYFAPGGIDAELKSQGVEDRQHAHADELRSIVRRYPDLAKTYQKAGGVTNIRLKTITHARIPWIAPRG